MVIDVVALIAWAQATVTAWGLLGIFFINLINSATIIFPLPFSFITFLFVKTINPWLIVLAAAAGAAIGELTGYGVGYGGRTVLQDKNRKWVQRFEKWSEKHGPFTIILVVASSPIPTDFVGLFSGIIAYNVRKFLIAVFIGKFIKFTVLVFGFLLGLDFFLAAIA